MSETLTVTLGGKEYTAAYFPLRKVKKIMPQVVEVSNLLTTQGMTEDAMDKMAAVVALQFDIENMDDLEVTGMELKVAFDAVAQKSMGMTSKKDQPQTAN